MTKYKMLKNLILANWLCFYLPLRWMLRINLGDEVWYQGCRYTILNGAVFGKWRLSIDEDLVGGEQGTWVNRAHCVKVLSLKSCIISYRCGYSFYKYNWYGIWKNVGIEPWMRECAIWAKD